MDRNSNFNFEEMVQSDYLFDEKRLAALFKDIDTGKDGKICYDELREYLRKYNFDESLSESIIERGDIKRDGKLDYQEFMLFMLEHEQHLWDNFKHLDRDKNGYICYDDLRSYCEEHNLNIPKDRINEIITRLDKDNNLKIDWEEFREFHKFRRVNTESMFLRDALGWSYSDNVIHAPEQETANTEQDFKRHIICGAIAGATSRCVTAPLDRLKVLLQVQNQVKVASRELNITQMLLHMIKNEGIRSMWRGNAVNVCKIMPEQAMRFFLFEYFLNSAKHLLPSLNENHPTKFKFLCGACTGLTVQTMVYPWEIVKTRRMTSPKSIPIIISELGLSGLWRGITPALAGVMPFAAIELGLSRHLTDHFKASGGSNELSWNKLLLIGATSTTVAMASTYPFRLMTCQVQASDARTKSPGLVGWFADTFKRYDKFPDKLTKGFYRGFMANAIKTIPSSAIVWWAYNKSQTVYDSYTYDR